MRVNIRCLRQCLIQGRSLVGGYGDKCFPSQALTDWHLDNSCPKELLQCRGLKKQANELRSGNILELGGRLYQIIKLQHTQGHGRQLGNVQMELRDLQSQTKLHERRRPSDMVELVRLEGRPYQVLYSNAEGGLHLMDPNTFEQEEVPAELFGSGAAYLAPDASVTLLFGPDGKAVSGELPQTLELKVVDAEPYAKGDSAASSYKACTVETGARVSVPPYVLPGDVIIIDPASGTFVKRATP